MAYASILMFMGKLNHLINCNHNQLINNPEIIRERPRFQLLYDDLGSMIQTLFIDKCQDLHDLEKLLELKKRFIDAAEEAEYIVDMFLSGVHFRNNRHLPASGGFKRFLNLDDVRRSFKCVLYRFLSGVHFKRSLNLDDVRRSFMSVEVDFKSMKMDSSERTLIQSVPASLSISRNSHGSKKILDEIVVGLDRDVELIRDKLVEDKKKVDVVSIVGMGGIGKTTLANKVFNDGYVKHHFHVRVWVAVSQTYDKRAVLVQILESIRGQRLLENASDARLRELVHKSLMGKRYFIVIDDIWHIETWDNIKVLFPHGNNGSRILLTTRLTEVAKHANSDGLIHHLGYFSNERSWELLCQKVFNGNDCPEWSIIPGMKIVENCHGLPLAVAVIAGVLAKEALREKFWVEIAKLTSSYIVDEKNGCLETLGLSYNHLPVHLRECFLYLGGFPDDYLFEVNTLIWLWVAEGFIQEDGDRRLEDIAEGYLMDLIDRNLVIIANKSNSDGAVKACKVHDLVRELCLKKGMEEQFILETERLILSSNAIRTPYKLVRKFINTYDPDLSHPSTQNLRSIMWFNDFGFLSDIAKHFRSFVLLRVLDIQNLKLRNFPKGMELLVHLRYLAVCNSSEATFPSSICKLWNLQTLIYIAYHKRVVYNTNDTSVVLPSNISDLVNLRHLWSWNSALIFRSIEKPMNLQTVSGVRLEDKAHSFQKYFPYIKELACTTATKKPDFRSLTYLERLTLWSSPVRGKSQITFPATLKTLTLEWCRLPWSDMSIIQLLLNLQVLKLRSNAFEGKCWNKSGHEFPQLKFLRLKGLDVKFWEVDSTSFPCLKRLEIISCIELKEVPPEIGDIPTLEFIKIKECGHSVGESVRRIQEEQHDMGNYDLRIDVIQGKD